MHSCAAVAQAEQEGEDEDDRCGGGNGHGQVTRGGPVTVNATATPEDDAAGNDRGHDDEAIE